MAPLHRNYAVLFVTGFVLIKLASAFECFADSECFCEMQNPKEYTIRCTSSRLFNIHVDDDNQVRALIFKQLAYPLTSADLQKYPYLTDLVIYDHFPHHLPEDLLKGKFRAFLFLN